MVAKTNFIFAKNRKITSEKAHETIAKMKILVKINQSKQLAVETVNLLHVTEEKRSQMIRNKLIKINRSFRGCFMQLENGKM